MALEFGSNAPAGVYGAREVTDVWRRWAADRLAPSGKDVVDIGCGAGIYSRGFAGLGARSVVGIDLSEAYVAEAAKASPHHPSLRFALGRADATGLPESCADLAYMRAVIHHLSESEQAAAAAEMLRVLRPGGQCVVQDRTLADVEADAPEYWIRATLVRLYPRLIDVERARRPNASAFTGRLRRVGFEEVVQGTLAETRKIYDSFTALETEILTRRGKSILFELTDEQLRAYCEALRRVCPPGPVVEIDPWTVWFATSPNP